MLIIILIIFFSIIMLNTFIPIIYLSNTLYTFIFVLELLSITILYKFSVSRNWFENSNFLNKNKKYFW